MSHQQFHAEVQQWAELEADMRKELDQAPPEEIDPADAEFCAELEEKYPILKSWSTK